MSKNIGEITIRINPLTGTIKVEEYIGGVVSIKNLNPADLVECLKRGLTESKVIQSGFLPHNCLAYEVNNTIRTVMFSIPPGHIDLTYHKTVYERFPLPAMVFSLSVNQSGRPSNCRLAVVPDGRLTPNSMLYHYPFSNVYMDTSICIGAANSLPTYKDLRTLGSLPYHILALPNNDHNFDRSHNKGKLGYRELLDSLKDKEPAFYYDHVLIPRNEILRDFIENTVLGGM